MWPCLPQKQCFIMTLSWHIYYYMCQSCSRWQFLSFRAVYHCFDELCKRLWVTINPQVQWPSFLVDVVVKPVLKPKPVSTQFTKRGAAHSFTGLIFFFLLTPKLFMFTHVCVDFVYFGFSSQGLLFSLHFWKKVPCDLKKSRAQIYICKYDILCKRNTERTWLYFIIYVLLVSLFVSWHKSPCISCDCFIRFSYKSSVGISHCIVRQQPEIQTHSAGGRCFLLHCHSSFWEVSHAVCPLPKIRPLTYSELFCTKDRSASISHYCRPVIPRHHWWRISK